MVIVTGLNFTNAYPSIYGTYGSSLMLGLKRLSLTFIRKQKKALKSFQKALFLKKTLKPDAKPSILRVPFLKEQYLVMEKSNTFWLVLTHVSSTVRLRLVDSPTHPDRIIVVSDTVCRDKLRTNMIKQAAPSGVQVHVIPIKKHG